MRRAEYLRGFGQTTLSGEVKRVTEGAILFDPEDGDEFWLPRRVCLDGASVDEGDVDIVVADWWLKQEGKL